MTTRDTGLGAHDLRTVAWITGAVAAFGWAMAIVVLDGDDPGAVALLAWAILAFTMSLASASFAVVSGVKNAERRVSEQLTRTP